LIHSGIPASQVMKRLTRILWGLEIRGNTIVAFFLNVFFLWDILMMRRLENWRREYREAFASWTGIIADFEVINSLSTLAFNQPGFTYPVISEGPFRLKLIEAGHPLIHSDRRVDNSLSFDKPGDIYLVTGPNMAGKSTLLRMVGVNMILGMAGAPVCARVMEMVPVTVSTSVRTNDSLGDDESYFYAELKKLNRIIVQLESGKQIFVIIDEMLKGTNSADKHAGSAALIRRLTGMDACGLVATHDVELGSLEEEFPGRLQPFCFEAETKDDLFVYDYRLREGVSRSLNATFLMQKMGIIEGRGQERSG
jgi:DNA mismatch repair ATPase MutS